MAAYKNWTFRIGTPDGTMFVEIMENEKDEPFEIHLHIGKSGSSLAAWAASTAGMVSLALRAGIDLQDIIESLRDITSDGTARIGASSTVRSGPEGIYSALIQYRNLKKEEEVAPS